MSIAEQVKLALQLDTLKFECRELQDRLSDLGKAIKEQDVDGIEFFLSSMKTELVTCINSHVGLWGVLFKIYVKIHHANK